jgi:hypothetical protein
VLAGEARGHRRLAAGAVRLGAEAADAGFAAEPVRLRPTRVAAVGDREGSRRARAPEANALVEPVLAAGEDDDPVGAARQVVFRRKDEQVRGCSRKRRDEREDDELQWLIARSTASSSSGDSALEGRPWSSSFM